MKHVEARVNNLLCDECGYKQPVRIQDIGSWVGALCPDCGAPLLTAEDYAVFQNVLEFVKCIDDVAQELEALGDPEILEAINFGEKASLSISCKDGELEVGEVKRILQ